MLGIGLFLCIAVLTAWAYFYPRDANDKNSFQRRFRGIIFWLVFLIWLGLSIFNIVEEENQKTALKKERDSAQSKLDRILGNQETGKEENKKFGAKIDSLQSSKDTIRVPKKGKPLLFPCPASLLSKGQIKEDLSYSYQINICNLGELAATNVRFVNYHVWGFGGRLEKVTQEKVRSQPMSIAPGMSLIMENTLPRLPGINTIFIFVKISYDDENSRGYSPERFVFIYEPRVREFISLTGGENYAKVAEAVKQAGAW